MPDNEPHDPVLNSEPGKDIVLVVGGAVGGRKIVELLLRQGSYVIVADKNTEAAVDLKRSLEKKGLDCSSLIQEYVDATDPELIAQLATSISKKPGYLNHMISVIGGASQEEWRGLEETSIEQINQTTTLNLLSHQYLIRAMKPLLVKAPGLENSVTNKANKSIVMVGSINALRSFDLPSYSAAKAGMIGLMYGAAREFTLDHGIRINIVAPGTMLSERTAKSPRNIETLMQHSLLAEMPEAEEIAEACLMFTHRLPHCTQQMLVIDSGQTAFAPPHNNLFE